MDTRVVLIHHGATDWDRSGRIVGRRDRPLHEDGRAQAARMAEALAGVPILQVISSPLQHALETAEILCRHNDWSVARDGRLTEVAYGEWEGKTWAEFAGDAESRRFLADPLGVRHPGGELANEVRRRAVAAVAQALDDCPVGGAIAAVTHGDVIRALIGHYLGAPPATGYRLAVLPGSISIASLPPGDHAQVRLVNWQPHLAEVLGP